MIISHSRQFIFFDIPKSATHADREALRQGVTTDDWEQQILFDKQSIPIPEIKKIEHGHISAKQIQPVLSIEQWQDYKKIAFVRHPFDRFVSACAFLNRANADFQKEPIQWMKSALQRSQFKQRLLIQPQSELLINERGDLVTDFIGRYETLQQSVDQLLLELGLPKYALAQRNRSFHRHYSEYLDDELSSKLQDLYRRDFELLGYS